MAGPSAPRAFHSVSGWVKPIPIDRDNAIEVYGDMPEDVWHEIEVAYRAFERRTHESGTSKVNKNKNDPDSWYTQKNRALKSLSRAFDEIHGLRDLRRFFSEAAQLYRFKELDGRGSTQAISRDLREIKEALRKIIEIVDLAEPDEREIATDGAIRQEFARTIRCILVTAGLSVELSDKRTIDQTSTYENLKPIERLIRKLEIHVSASPEAHVQWVYRALQ